MSKRCLAPKAKGDMKAPFVPGVRAVPHKSCVVIVDPIIQAIKGLWVENQKLIERVEKLEMLHSSVQADKDK